MHCSITLLYADVQADLNDILCWVKHASAKTIAWSQRNTMVKQCAGVQGKPVCAAQRSCPEAALQSAPQPAPSATGGAVLAWQWV